MIAALLLSALAAPAPEHAEDFALIDASGRFHTLHEHGDADAVLLVSFSVGSEALGEAAPRVERAVAEAEAAGRDTVLLFVAGDPHDGRAAVRARAAELGLSAPVLMDANQLVLQSLGVEHAARAVLIDPSDWRVVWRGPAGSGALAARLRGERADSGPVSAPASGERIPDRFAREGTPDFARDVVPVLRRRCIGCHREGGIGPWAMSSHARVRGWAPMVRETILAKRMPPWHADPEVGRFANDRSLRPAEERTLVRWIDAGAPRGEGEDRLPLLAAEGVHDDWPLGEPDLVLPLIEVRTPPTGLLPYIYDTVEITTPKDLWVRGVTVRPSNTRTLHHALIILEYPEELKHLEPVYQGGAGSTFGFYVPGTEPHFFPEGTGKLLPRGAKMIVQLHYVTTGREELDRSELGLYLLGGKPEFEYETTSATDWTFVIPPGDPEFVVEKDRVFDRDVLLFDLTPHMHYRGKEMRYDAHYPDGRTVPLLAVMNYDFNWQTTYQLEEPVLLPAGTRVRCRAVFDNSAANPANPDPTRAVPWGLQSTDEMFIGYMSVRAVHASQSHLRHGLGQ